MRKIIMIISTLILASQLMAENYRIISTKNGKDVSIRSWAKELAKSDVVFFGEKHDDPTLHSLQRQLLPVLHKQQKRLIVSFEMFERDVQSVIDAYLKDELTEAEFLQQSRPWGNYDPDYRSLLEYAKRENLKVLAANIPREYASRVVRSGTEFLESLSPEEQKLMAKEISAPAGTYKESFLQTMGLVTAHGMPGDANVMDRLFYAQCMKDDTMAESIKLALEANPKHKVIHFNGDFHSRSYLGTVERLKNRLPKLRIKLISYEFSPDIASYVLPDQATRIADYLIVLPEGREEE
ncbi:MAG TPA: ChaN family lipoprotein [Candidatus Cloacimonadota bacterium]|nr:ChaN family lipoprotein [Candidatus Cloacimonadota bacterium]